MDHDLEPAGEQRSTQAGLMLHGHLAESTTRSEVVGLFVDLLDAAVSARTPAASRSRTALALSEPAPAYKSRATSASMLCSKYRSLG